MVKKQPGLSWREKYVAVMASKSWYGEVPGRGRERLLFIRRYRRQDVVPNGGWKYVEEWVQRSPSNVRRLFAARRNHEAYVRTRRFCELARTLKFDNGCELRKLMDEYRSIGGNAYTRAVLHFADAELDAEKMSEKECERALLARLL